MYFACENEGCRVLIFKPGFGAFCPVCSSGGKRLDTDYLDALFAALKKRIVPEQTRLKI